MVRKTTNTAVWGYNLAQFEVGCYYIVLGFCGLWYDSLRKIPVPKSADDQLNNMGIVIGMPLFLLIYGWFSVQHPWASLLTVLAVTLILVGAIHILEWRLNVEEDDF